MRNRVCRIFPILTLILLVLLFAACGKTDSPEPGTTDAETETETESESRERGPQVDISSLNSKMLGLTPYAVTSSDLYVSEGAVTSAGNLAVRSYEEGVALLTVSDYWGYTAEVTVTVSGAKAEIVVTKKFSQENVANVRMFGANGTGSGNDSEAFQKAIDSLPEEGGEVLVPAGV